MGIGPNPGLTVKVECTSNSGHVASLSGDGVSVSIGGAEETVEYFKVGSTYVAHFRLSDGSGADGGNQAAPAS